MIESPRDIIITAVREAARKTNPAFEKVLETHLEKKLGKGFEIAYEDPEKFKVGLRDLFGEYSARFFEILVINEVVEKLKLGERPNTLEELVSLLSWWKM
ncbi:MAG: hypothetical protein PWR13_925 [Archaeoglobi archaeon]|nr:hypothetical protein [Archaeoglobi archaeon]MDK2781897.1 hypothetical protein [Archaeoglobi archaeon]